MKEVEVYYTNARTGPGQNMLDKLEGLCTAIGLKQIISSRDLVAIKLHFGEYGNLAHIRPQYLKKIIDIIKRQEATPFLTDTNTLYSGSRKNACNHLTSAFLNGFSYSTVGAPVIIADGLLGLDYVDVPVNLKHFKSTKIASSIFHSDTLIGVSHFKLHEATGFGGTLKNLGMGCAASVGKQNIHCEIIPKILRSKCQGCGNCILWCPREAIYLENNLPVHATRTQTGKAQIVEKLCYGCGECVAICKFGAVEINWKTDSSVLQEKLVEYAFGALKNKKNKFIFLNFLLNISPDCDCTPWNDMPIVPDIGILASFDPVAIDEASVNLLNKTKGMENTKLKNINAPDKIFEIHKIKWEAQLDYAEKIGLGHRKYKLRELR